MLCGFLAPDGTYTECTPRWHTWTAEKICRTYNKNPANSIEAENFLLDTGYVIFYAKGAGNRFIVNGKIQLLSDIQKDFLINHIIDANCEEQKEYIYKILEQNDEFMENNFLNYYTEKLLKGDF